MLHFPHINPVALSIGPLKIHWYGLMYLIGFVSAWLLAHWRVRYYQLDWTSEQISDLIFYAALGVIIGGRSGYMLFYNFPELVHQPLSLFKIWQGGMSFHGGLLGVLIALWLFSYKYTKGFWELADFIAPLAPIGLGAGRIGNFINGELWGRVTNMPWGMIYKRVDNQPRHPSQLYEFALEGIGLFLLIWFYSGKSRPLGRTSALFLIAYGLCRTVAEFFRQPDPQLGYIALGCVTMGQFLSIPMLLLGLWLWWVKR